MIHDASLMICFQEFSDGKDVSSLLSETLTYSSTGSHVIAARKHDLGQNQKNSVLAGPKHYGINATRKHELGQNQRNPLLAGSEHKGEF